MTDGPLSDAELKFYFGLRTARSFDYLNAKGEEAYQRLRGRLRRQKERDEEPILLTVAGAKK